jgi:hypothetical protein
MTKRKWTPEEREEFRQQQRRWDQNDREFKAMYEGFKARWAADIDRRQRRRRLIRRLVPFA